MKPNVNYVEAFSLFIENESNAPLKEYMNRLNREVQSPKQDVEDEQPSYDEMSYNELRQLADKRGLIAGITGKPKGTTLIELLEREDARPVYGKTETNEATDKLTLKDMKAFPDSILHSYLKQKSSSAEDSRDAILQGEQFQGRFIYNQDGSIRSGEQIKELVEDELERKFPALERVKTKKKSRYINTLMKLAAPKKTGKGSASLGSSSQVIDAVSNDKTVTNVLGLFMDRDKRTLTPKRVFEDYYRTIAADKVPNYAKWANYAKKNYRLKITDADLKEAIRTLESDILPEFRRPTRPFLDMLVVAEDDKVQELGNYRVSTLNASDVIGRLDMKKAEKRNDIYRYWKKISENEWEDFKKAHQSFVEAINKLDVKNLNAELKDRLEKFTEFDVEQLNYIKQYSGVEIEDIRDTAKKAIFILRDFLKEKGELPPEKIMYMQNTGEKNDDVVDLTTMDTGTEPVKDDLEEDLLEAVVELTQRKVDPLYAYVLEETDALPTGAVIEDQLDDIEDELKTGLVMVEMGDLIPLLEQYLKNMRKAKIGNLGAYYLPVVPQIRGYAAVRTEGDFDEKKDPNVTVANYIKLFSEFIQYGEKNEVRSKGGTTGLTPKSGFARTTIGRAGTNAKTHMLDFKEQGISDKFDVLLEKIVAFFIEPSRNQNKPFDSPLPFIDKVGSRAIETIALEPAAGESPFIHLLRMESTDWKFNKTQLNDILDFLKAITRVNVGSAQNQLVTATEQLGEMLNDIYAGEMEDMLEIELGNFLHGVFTKANLPDLRFGLGTKKNVSELSEKYEKSRIYPFEAVFNHLFLKKESYSDPDTGVDGAKETIAGIMAAEAELDIVKSKEHTLIMEAHDEIRKMLGKKIYYGIASTNDFDAVSSAIDYMSDLYKTDITAMDIENVVNELDSMSNISTKYGVPKEGVYFLKANFR
mgnify:CR=1 FL=1